MAKGKKGKNQLVDEKKKELQKFWDNFQSQCEQYENRINGICNETCTKISKMYEDKLKKIPENIRNMTITEYMELQKQPELPETQFPRPLQEPIVNVSIIRSQYEKSKLESEKKKTLKKNRIERKRSLSASVCSTGKGFHPTFPRTSRILSESCLNTPISKQSVVPSFVITPKFNPKAPVVKACMRRPRAGEMVMSLSGSPLHNFVDDISEKPCVSISLGGGKIIKITEDAELGKFENEFMKKLDAETKSTLASVKEKLDKILQS